MSKKEYDFIFAIGESCSATRALRSTDLQVQSYPLDWVYGGNFLTRIDILTSKFANFLEKSYFIPIEVDEAHPYFAFSNRACKVTFMHDFLKNKTFDESYNEFKEKYERRIKRLYEKIEQSNKILILYLENPYESLKIQGNEKIIEGYSRLKQMWPDKNIDILYVECDENLSDEIKKEALTSNVTKIVANYRSKELSKERRWIPKLQTVKKIFADIKLKK